MTGTGDDEPLVWYAAYGSNLWGPRFLTYLTGGAVAHSTSGRVQTGARDPSPPRAHRRAVLPHRLFFARSSTSWGGGGVAFIRPDGGDNGDSRRRWAPEPAGAPGEVGPISTTLARLWLVTASQFIDIASQENGRPIGPGALDVVDLAAGAQRDVCDGWYGRVLHLGPGPGDRPVLTFTCPDADADDVVPRPAHPAYLRVVGLGLMEAWSLHPQAAARYLIARSLDGADPAQEADPHPVEALAADLAAAAPPDGGGADR